MGIFNKLIGFVLSSLDTFSKGASARKLSAFWMIVILTTSLEITYLVWAYKNGNFELVPVLVDANLLFSAVCLGLVTYEYVKGRKTDEQNSNPGGTPPTE